MAIAQNGRRLSPIGNEKNIFMIVLEEESHKKGEDNINISINTNIFTFNYYQNLDIFLKKLFNYTLNIYIYILYIYFSFLFIQ